MYDSFKDYCLAFFLQNPTIITKENGRLFFEHCI